MNKLTLDTMWSAKYAENLIDRLNKIIWYVQNVSKSITKEDRETIKLFALTAINKINSYKDENNKYNPFNETNSKMDNMDICKKNIKREFDLAVDKLHSIFYKQSEQKRNFKNKII